MSGSIATTAGCASALGPSRSGPELRDITFRNVDDNPHTVEFGLDHDGERILEATYELGPRTFGDGDADHLAAIDDAWDSPTGEFTAAVRVDGGTRVEFRLDDGVDPAATYRYEIRISDGGEVSTWSATVDGTTTE